MKIGRLFSQRFGALGASRGQASLLAEIRHGQTRLLVAPLKAR
jgi:hypothetical protein